MNNKKEVKRDILWKPLVCESKYLSVWWDNWIKNWNSYTTLRISFELLQLKNRSSNELFGVLWHHRPRIRLHPSEIHVGHRFNCDFKKCMLRWWSHVKHLSPPSKPSCCLQSCRNTAWRPWKCFCGVFTKQSHRRRCQLLRRSPDVSSVTSVYPANTQTWSRHLWLETPRCRLSAIMDNQEFGFVLISCFKDALCHTF